MAVDYTELLSEIANEKSEYGEAVNAPVPQSLEQVNRAFRQMLNSDCDPDFYEFCRRMNGLDWNGLVLYSILNPGEDRGRNVFDNNLEWRENDGMSDYVVFGDNGMDLIAKNIATGGFELLMKPSFDSVETFESFSDVLANQLEQYR